MAPEIETWARKYVWWETPEDASRRPVLLLCQLMQLGTWEDVKQARQLFGDAAFMRALESAPPGVLDAKSWHYWHLFFGLALREPPQRPLPGFQSSPFH
jgi:hypothetical protein